MTIEAEFYEKKDDQAVECYLCPHNCYIKEGKSGICRARVNRDGTLYTENYGKISSIGVDPIEKKPLYHFYPGSEILSLGTFGCNFSCDFCQNWQISQEKPRLKEYKPEEIIKLAEKRNIDGIAYTYSEPSVWYEYVKDTAKLAAETGLKNVLVTNGYISEEPLKKLLPVIDAANVDLKAFSSDFYKKYCGGTLNPVLHNIELMHDQLHLELTTLLINGINDDRKDLKELFAWIQGLDRGIPLHVSRYFPNYQMEEPATPLETMQMAFELAREYLDYVYLGNTTLKNVSDTICPQCETKVISRSFYQTRNHLEDSHCPECGIEIKGKF